MKKTYTNEFINLKYKINDILKIKKYPYSIDYNYSQGKRKIELILYHLNEKGFYENTIQNRKFNIFLGYGNSKEVYKILYCLYCYISKSKDTEYLYFNRG